MFQPRHYHSTFLALVLALAATARGSGATGATAGLRVRLEGSIKQVPVGAPFSLPHRVRETLTAAELAESLNFAVSLRMRNLDELEARIQSGQTVPQSEMEARYLPLPADHDRIASWLRSQGFTLRLVDSNHTNLFASGTISQISAAFDVAFARVATGDGEFSSAVTAPSLPEDLSGPVVAIDGLQPHIRMHPPRQRPEAVATYDGYFTPADIAAAYSFPSGFTGAGQTIAVIMEAAPVSGDLGAFYNACGITATYNTYTEIAVLGGPTGSSQAAAAREIALDTEWSTGMAPGARLRVYELSNLNTSNILAACTQILADAAADPSLRVVSYSGSGPESQYTAGQLQSDSQTFAQLAAAGITFLASSGDGGSNPNPLTQSNGYSPSNVLTAEYPASDPYVTGVGGTTATFNSAWAVTAETAWTPGSMGTGGGISAGFSRPSWQSGTGVPAGTRRCVPDVAAVSNANTPHTLDIGALIILNGQASGEVGTSLSTPVWAAVVAVANQTRSSLGMKPLGLLGPWIYPLIGTGAFRDITAGNNGQYSAGVGYDLCTGIGSPNVTNLISQINEEITFTAPPSTPVNAGSAVSMSATAQLTATYQWRLNGVAIPGATGSTYSIAKASSADAGSYTVAITSALGSFTYAIGTLTVNVPPIITTQPSPQTVSVGQAAAFTVAASGVPAPSYQWQKNGVGIAGATGATYAISSAQLTDAGSYTVVASNTAGSAASSAAILTVTAFPVFTVQPQSQSVAPGSSATFSASAGVTPAPAFQWYFNGQPIPGATGSSYTLAGVLPSNSGSYTVVATNAAGATASSVAMLTVAAASGGPAIAIQPVSQSITPGGTVVFRVTQSGAVPSSSVSPGALRAESLQTTASGAAGLTYQWYLNGALIAGAVSPILALKAAAGSAGAYTCLLENSSGSVLSSPATLSLASTGNPGRLVNFSVNATVDSSGLVMGFVTGGAGTTGSQSLLIRAGGPALTAYGVNGVLPDPQLTVMNGSAAVASNAGWGSPAANQAAVILAQTNTGAGLVYANPASLDSAIVLSLASNPGYTVTVSGQSGDSGRTLAEVYDNTPANAYTPATPRLLNASCRITVGANGNLTEGFYIGGTTSKTVLIRAIGPGLAAYGVNGAMSDPQLTVYTGSQAAIASNAGWGADTQLASAMTSVGALPNPPAAHDSVVLITLAPGGYTAVATSSSGASGNVLVDVYEVP